MYFNNYPTKPKKSSSKPKIHRRVVTELDQSKPHHAVELKKPERLASKPKFIDVYSKYLPKETNPARKNFKIHLGRQDKLRTEPDEVRKGGSIGKSPGQLGKYEVQGVAGKGTFGVVYVGVERGTGTKVAIKKVLQDRKYKNREQTILGLLKQRNVLSMRECFMTRQGEEEYLNIVMDYFPLNLYQLIKRKEISPHLLKVYAYQMFRGLNYLTMMSIGHRDIKPQNILVDPERHLLVITDFGSAKQLTPKETNLAYICSRCYRAPELIFGATDYTSQIDMWSAGCVLVEMVNGVPPFLGDSQIDQLKEIIKILGTPSESEVGDMNKAFDVREVKRLPQIKKIHWSQFLQNKDPLLVDLVTRTLRYSPSSRITAAQALLHEYFDDLRDQTRYQQILFKVKSMPQLFDFSKEELNFILNQTKVKYDLVPEWAVKRSATLQLGNKITSASTNTKRSIMSFKAL